MNAADLYSKTLQGYSSILSFQKVSLSQYCKEHKVNYRELCHWMRENSIPVPHSNQPFRPALAAPSLAPVTILSPESPVKPPSCPSPVVVLKDVQINLPNGVHVSIREINGADMAGLIDKLKPC